MAIRNSWKNSDGMTRAHAAPAAGFKNCCMPKGWFDGSNRAYFFLE
jgi:hypothetical protein